MSLWQHLATSYDKNADALKTGYPLSATSISNKSEWIAVIVIDGDGNFLEAYKIDKAPKGTHARALNIPVTEKSAGRTSSPEPYPVFDQYEYLKGFEEKFDGYIKQLNAFANSGFATPQVKAIQAYVSKKTVATDLKNFEPKVKTNIVFEVQCSGDPQSKVWEDSSLFDAWHRYYLSTKNNTALDSISGSKVPLAESHPKKISNSSANSKLMSANDTANFTFRGRFEDSEQAVSVGYETSQQAHQFLRYLINDRGITCGTQVILSFTVGALENTLPPPLNDTKSIWDFLQGISTQTDSDRQISLRAETGFDYANALKKAFAGFKYGKALEQHASTAVLALDAPSDGRMSVTFYREISRGEYLEKIAEWHEDCKWTLLFWSDETQRYIPYIGAPSVDRIIEVVYGKPRGHTDDGYTKIKKGARERLLRCIFDGALLPIDYVVSAVRRASNPLAVPSKNGGFDRNGFEQLVSTACALVRKDFKQHKKEDYTLSLEPERTDRGYLYGRLLGAADKLEEYALHKKDNNRIVTAAIRYMQTFSQRPFRTWQTIHACLNPYIQTVKGSFAFNEIQAVIQLFKPGDFENDAPLNGSYLIGYYHERAYIAALVAENKSKKQSTSSNSTEENNE